MKREELITFLENGVCTVAIGLMLTAFFPSACSALNAEQPPPKECAPVSKSEYDSAKKQNLLCTRFMRYVKTGRLLKRHYWYCHS
jgi:hypothetical protein